MKIAKLTPSKVKAEMADRKIILFLSLLLIHHTGDSPPKTKIKDETSEY